MGSWVCTGDSKSLLVHIYSDLGRGTKAEGLEVLRLPCRRVGMGKEEEAWPGMEGRGQGKEGAEPGMAIPGVSGLGMSRHLI